VLLLVVLGTKFFQCHFLHVLAISYIMFLSCGKVCMYEAMLLIPSALAFMKMLQLVKIFYIPIYKLDPGVLNLCEFADNHALITYMTTIFAGVPPNSLSGKAN
jgi:hypothetical protein